MTESYKVLWIDDEHEKLKPTKGRFKEEGIDLVAFKSLETGMRELERNYLSYDGILLDAKFFDKESDVAGSEDTQAIFDAKDRINQLPKKFDLFVLTGQSEAYADKTFKKVFKNVYEKGDNEESKKLIEDLKQSAKNQQDTQVRHQYPKVFEVCNGHYLSEATANDLLVLLKKNDNEIEIENPFNAIRKIVDDLFIAFNKFELLPRRYVIGTVSINPSKNFLIGDPEKEKGYQNKHETRLPKHIALHLEHILKTTQAGSHRSLVDTHVKQMKTPYMIKSVIFQLLDVIVWFKTYIDSNPKKNNWESIPRRTR
jgi:hypothetical protein